MTVPVLELTGEPCPAGSLLAALWRSRALLLMLARKDFFVRYRRASFGVLWAVGLPLVQAVVLVVVFSRIVRITTTANYSVFVLSALLPWTFFSSTLTTASTSIVDGSALSTRIYFPRAVFPLVAVTANLYGFVLSLGVLLAACIVVGAPLGKALLLLAPATVLLVALTAAFSLVLAALHVYSRDVRYLVQAAVVVWFYVTPIIYPLTLAKGLSRWLAVNPLTGVVELFRAATVGADAGTAAAVWWTLGWTMALATVALVVHRRFDRVFVDLL